MADEISARISQARAAWSPLEIDEGRVRAWLSERLGDGEDAKALCIDDLYLTCACAHGDPIAVRLFEERFMGDLEVVLKHMRLDNDLRDEVKQTVRDKILVGPTPKIADYSGRGALRSWLRAVVTRTALDVLRKRARTPTSEEDLYRSIPAAIDDPETAALRTRYAAEFAQAFRASFAALSTSERLLLKRHFVDGLTTEQLGALQHVHRVTVLRHLSQALEKLAAQAQEQLLERLKLPRSEYESIVRLVRSQLDVSIGALISPP